MPDPTATPEARWKWNASVRSVEQGSGEARSFVLHDPEDGDYFQLGPAELGIAREFDAGRTLEEVRARCAASGTVLEPGELSEFVAQLAEARILLPVSEAPEATPSPPARRRAVGRLLHLELAAFDAGPFFARTLPWVRPLLGRGALVAGAGAVLAALVVTVGNGRELQGAVHGLLTGTNLLTLWLVYATVVLLHELAHGWACARFGGRVAALGFLLLYGKPCAYCDVTDAWMLGKGPRLWIMAAGSLLELGLWAVATLVWRVAASETALYQTALVVLTLCGVGTLFNFNPLIRFDGYYMLSDGLGIPNLRQRAFEDLKRRLFGRGSTQATPRERRIFLAYGLVAVAYSGLLVGYLLVRVHGAVAERWGGTGVVLLWAGLGALAARPLGSFVREGVRSLGVTRTRRIVGWGSAGLVLALLVFGRWPLKIAAESRVEPRARVVVRSPLEGTVGSVAVNEGDIVLPGQVLVELETRDLDFELATTRAEAEELGARLALLESGPRRQEIELALQQVEEAVARLDLLRRQHERAVRSLESDLVSRQAVEIAERELRTGVEAEAAARKSLEILQAGTRPEEIRAMRARLESVRSRVARIEDERARTRILAPIGGQVLTAHAERLANRFVERGDSLLLLADLDTVRIEIPVPEKEVADVRIGAPVRFKSRSLPGQTFAGRVVEIAAAAEAGPRQRTVLVRSELDNRDRMLRPGTSGFAKIYCGNRSVGELLVRRGMRSVRTEFWALW